MDIPGEKLIIKIWDSVVDNGLASLLRPWQMRREGNAKIEIERLSALWSTQIEQDIKDIREGRKEISEDGELVTTQSALRVSWANPRIRPPSGQNPPQMKFLKQQLNLERILAKSIEHASNVSDIEVSDEPVDEDWLSRWSKNAEDISDEKLGEIWAKILAGEVQRPGRYSLQTINLLAVLGRKEASLIEKYARSVIFGSALMNLEGDDASVDELCELADLGFLSRYQGSLGLTRNTNRASNDKIRLIDCWGAAIVCAVENPSDEITVPVLSLSRAGIELLQLGSFEPDLNQLKRTARDLIKPNSLYSLTKISRVGIVALERHGGQSAFKPAQIEWLT